MDNTNLNNDNIDELFNNLKNNQAKDKKSNKNLFAKNAAVIFIGIILIIAVLIAMALYTKSDRTTTSKTGTDIKIMGNDSEVKKKEEKKKNEENKKRTKTKKEKEKNEEEQQEVGHYLTSSVDPIKSVVKLEEWQKKYRKDLSKSQKEEMYNYVSDGVIGRAFAGMPSAKEGFISDPKKMLDENYVPNPSYVDLTKEEYIEQMSDIVNRITNPIYGGWAIYQMEDSNKEDVEKIYNYIFRDVKTDFFTENIDKKELVNVLPFDYGNNGYNGKFTPERIDTNGTRLFGNTKKLSIVYDDARKMKAYLIVEYSYPDGSTFDKNIQLDLEIVDNKLLLDNIKSN